jgi:hypothetical protein
MFESLGNGQFADVARPLGCAHIKDSRGVAIADLNSDGRLDMVISNNADPPVIYLNRLTETGDWFRIDLLDPTTSNPDALGARVELTLSEPSGNPTLTRFVESGSGFASQSELTLHFGLGQSPRIAGIDVVWPDGDRQALPQQHLSSFVGQWIQVSRGEKELQIVASHIEVASGRGKSAGQTQGVSE